LYKKYLQRAFVLFLSLFFLLIAFNYFIDPYGYQSRNGKFTKNLSMFNKPHVSNARLNSHGYYYLIGSSRMSRVDPNLIEKLTGKDTHNLKIDGATLSENAFIASKIKEQSKFFIYSFDAFSLNKNRESFKEINNRFKVYQNELTKNSFFDKYYNSDITLRSLQHVIKFFRNESYDKQNLEENIENSSFSFDLAKNSSGFLNNSDKGNFLNYESYSNKEIIQLAKLGTKNDIFVIFPKYKSYYYLFAKYQEIESKYFESIKTLVENTDAEVWSFYGVNKITQDEQNFIDNGWHFKPELSNIIFSEIFISQKDSLSKTGFLITKENVSQYLMDLNSEIEILLMNDH
jgi:hypothetical protein